MKKVLIACDGSEGAQRALQTAIELFSEREILAPVVGVAEGVPPYGFAGTLPSPEHEKERQRHLEDAGNTLAEHGIASILVPRSGDPATAILDEARQKDVDMIVMGTCGLAAPERWLLGSVSTKVLHQASCSVLVAR